MVAEKHAYDTRNNINRFQKFVKQTRRRIEKSENLDRFKIFQEQFNYMLNKGIGRGFSLEVVNSACNEIYDAPFLSSELMK